MPEGRAHDSIEALLAPAFLRGCARLPQERQRMCSKAVRRLLEDPSSPALRLRQIQADSRYYEFQVGFRDRVVLRFEGDRIVFTELFSTREFLAASRRALHLLPEQ